MNCNCLVDIECKIKKNLKFKKPIERARVIDTAFIFEGPAPGSRTISHIELTLEGQKKKEEISMMHSFCPFCGERQNTNKPEKATANNAVA